jgi:hypothetical protein
VRRCILLIRLPLPLPRLLLLSQRRILNTFTAMLRASHQICVIYKSRHVQSTEITRSCHESFNSVKIQISPLISYHIVSKRWRRTRMFHTFFSRRPALRYEAPVLALPRVCGTCPHARAERTHTISWFSLRSATLLWRNKQQRLPPPCTCGMYFNCGHTQASVETCAVLR